MAETYAGITVPEGDPDGLRDAAQRMGAVGGALRASASELRGMPTMLGSWQGPASANYAGTCLSQSEAVTRQGDGWIMAAGATAVFASELEEARGDARRAIRDAEEATDRKKKAQTELEAAEAREKDANGRIAGALVELALEGLTGGVVAAAQDELRRARRDAEEAEDDIRHWRRERERAEEELERAQRRGKEAETRAHDAAQSAQTVFASIQAGMPRLVLPGPPPAAKPEPKDKPWYEDAADWTKGAADDAAGWTADRAAGLARGAGEGFQGLGEGGLMLYRLSAINGVIDPESYREEHEQLGEAARFAWSNPGEFGKALVNWEDLAAGRYDEWIGNLAPDAVAALVTGGAAPAVSRSLKGADAAGDLARNAERLSEGGRAYERAQRARDGLPPLKKFDGKASASNGEPTLSGWAQPRPNGYGSATPEDVRALADEIGHPLDPDTRGFRDQTSRPDGFPGKFNASHAEKQQALTSPGSDIAVTRPMCDDCVGFHSRLAKHTGQPLLVTDPEKSHLFLPDGHVVESPTVEDFPRLQDPLRFHGHAAAAGGAGSEGLSATQRDGG